MYKIIGADQKEYGPVTAAQITQWIAENRANGQTRVQAEGGTEWRPLSTFSEFATALATGVAPASAPSSAPPPTEQASSAAPTTEEILNRGDDLFRIGSCVRRGWELLKAKDAKIIGATVLFLLITAFFNVLARIPIVGLIAVAASMIVTGPLTGGLYRFYLLCIRDQEPRIVEIFSGFKSGLLQLILVSIVPGLMLVLTALPGGIICGVAVLTLGLSDPPGIVLLTVGVLVALVPMIYFSICWIFSVALVADREMDFWQAMQLSRSVVKRHWASAFCLMFVVGLVSISGILACGIGLLVSIPVGYGAFLYAYEDIFGARAGQGS